MEEVLAIFIILAFLAAAGGFVLLHLWQVSVRQHLEVIRKLLRRFQGETNRLARASQEYSPSDPEPYGSAARALNQQIGHFSAHIRRYYQDYSQFQIWLREIAPKDWKRAVLLPVNWYSAQQKAKDLSRKIERLATQVNETEAQLDHLRQLGWEVAVKARQALQDIQYARQVFVQLTTERIQDHALDECVQKVSKWEEQLNTRIPLVLLNGDEQSVFTQVEKETISQVYALTNQAAPEAGAMLRNAQEWKGLYESWMLNIEKLSTSLEIVSGEMEDQAKNQDYPIAWDQSNQQLEKLTSELDRLKPRGHSRSFSQLQHNLESARNAIHETQELTQHTYQVGSLHQRLVEALNSPEISQSEEWSRYALHLARKASLYHKDNFSPGDQIDKLESDLEQWAKLLHQGIPGDPDKVILESHLPVWLENTVTAKHLHSKLFQRVENVQRRLKEIESTEKSAHEPLLRSRALLGQTVSLVAANPFLKKNAGDEPDKLFQEIEALIQEFEKPEQGSVDKKAQKASGLLRKAEQKCATWMDLLERDLEANISKIKSVVAELSEVAQVDEQVILEAQKLISSLRRKEIIASSGAAPIPFTQVVSRIKQHGDDWQKCLSVTRALEDIADPVIERHQKAAQAREASLTQLEHASELIPDERSWPPTTQYITGERREFSKIEMEWQALKKESWKAIHLVSKLSDLSAQYQELSIRLTQIIEKTNQEQSKVTELERHIKESKDLWKSQATSQSENRIVTDSIQELLERVDADYRSLVKLTSRGQVPYNQVIQQLRGLCRQLDDAQIPLDSDQVLEINGIIHKRS